ncbi:MAG: SCO family protein [Gammaproteobacteria bacterium]
MKLQAARAVVTGTASGLGVAVLAAMAFSASTSGIEAPLGAPPAPGSYRLPCIESAGDGSVVTGDGEATTLHRLYADRIVVLSLIYTNCADAQGCPWATFTLAQTARRLEGDPKLASRVRFVSLSFDPARDTPEVMARYGRSFSHDPVWAFDTTRSPEALAPILADYDQRLQGDGGPAGGWSRLLRVFLIDEAHFVRNIYSSSFLDPVLVGNDIATLGLDRDQDGACALSGK